MKDINILIVPDVHGRDFWKIPTSETLENTNSRVIFLGDYLDPYAYEWEDPITGESTIDYQKKAIDTFKEILEIKKQYTDRISLLLGNHDACYAIGRHICDCRSDRTRYAEISQLFTDNHDLFQLADEETINKKHFIFSHAGISKTYAERCFCEEVNEFNVVNLFNNAWTNNIYGIIDSLGIYDYYRGWCGANYGSLVWADIKEWINNQQEGIGISVIGHSQVNEAINYKNQYYFLDCHKCSYIDNNGNILNYDTDKSIKEITDII